MASFVIFKFEPDYTETDTDFIPAGGLIVAPMTFLPRQGDRVRPSIFDPILSSQRQKDFSAHVELYDGLIVAEVCHINDSESNRSVAEITLVTAGHYHREKNLEFLSLFQKAMDVYNETRKKAK